MVYLLCFEKKFKHAGHYIGYANTQDSFEKRIKCHEKGKGARLMAAVVKAGIGFKVTRTWDKGDRNFERKLKNRKNASKLCPVCIEERKRRLAVLAQEKIVIAKLNEPRLIPLPTLFVEPIVPRDWMSGLQSPSEHPEHSRVLMPPINNLEVSVKLELEDKHAEPTSVPNTSRWQKLRHSLARLFRFRKSDSV